MCSSIIGNLIMKLIHNEGKHNEGKVKKGFK